MKVLHRLEGDPTSREAHRLRARPLFEVGDRVRSAAGVRVLLALETREARRRFQRRRLAYLEAPRKP